MASISLTPGYLIQDDEPLTPAILRLIAQPTVDLAGGIGTLALADNSVTTPKLADGALSADALGRGKMANGFLLLTHIATGIFTADAAGWAPFASGWLPLSLVGSGIFIPTPAGRAPFADGLINAALSQMDAFFYGTGGGTGAAYTVAVTPTLKSYVDNSGTQVFTQYWDGLVLCFKAVAACAAAATLAETSLNIVKGLYRMDGTAVKANDILSGSIIEVRYNSSLASGVGGWQLMSPPGGGGGQYQTPSGSYSNVYVDQAQMVEELHGLISTPKKVRWVLVCQTGENGYTAGDEVDVTALVNTNNNPVYSLGANATKVWVVRSSSTSAVTMIPRTGGGATTLASTSHIANNWKLKCYAEV